MLNTREILVKNINIIPAQREITIDGELKYKLIYKCKMIQEQRTGELEIPQV